MIGILLAKFKMFIRNPWTFVIFTGMSIGFAFVLSGTGYSNAIEVPMYAVDESVQDSIVGSELNESEAFTFKWLTEEEMMGQISSGKAEVGVKLLEDDFQMIIGVDSFNTSLVKQTLQSVYAKKQQQAQIMEASHAVTTEEKEAIQKELQSAMDEPIFSIHTGNFNGSVVDDYSFQPLFGFTLFFVIYTIAYNVLPILIEKSDGIWDRVILSPVRKWEMYVSNFIYSFITGYLQVLVIFLIFRFGVGVDFHGRFTETLLVLIPYVFAIVALAIFITALVKNPPQFNAVLPILAVSMAMIGGAYWPIEIVTSKILIALSKVNPLTYGMEVLNGVAVYGYPLEELLYPISILLLMGVIFTGVGIHLMEKRHV